MIKKEDENERKLRSQIKKLKNLVTILGIITICCGIFLGGLVVNKLLASDSTKRVSIEKSGTTNSFIGVDVIQLNEEIAKELGLKNTQGLIVNSVLEGSPAEKAGFKRGDFIVRFDEKKVNNINQLQNLVSQKSPDDRVKIVVDRDGRTKSLYVKVGQKTASLLGVEGQLRDRSRDPSTSVSLPEDKNKGNWGITLSPITPEIGQQFALGNRKGVVVVSVASDSIADKAGIKQGDLIMSVNKKSTPDLSTFYSAIDDKESCLLDIYRPASQTNFYVLLNVNPSNPPIATTDFSIIPSLKPRLTQSQLLQGDGKIALASTGPTFDSPLAIRFGTAQYFLIVDVFHEQLITAIPNYALQDTYRGYGARAAQLVANQKVSAVITSSIGPQAFEALNFYGIKIYRFTGNPREAISAYKEEKLNEFVSPSFSTGYARNSYLGTGQFVATNVTYCKCPVCGKIVPHPAGIPCSFLTCPDCGSRLVNISVGIKTGGKPENIPPMGKPEQTGYTFTGGSKGGESEEEEGYGYGEKPETIPPMGPPPGVSGAVNVVNVYQMGGISGSGGKPENIPPQNMGNKPENIPPVNTSSQRTNFLQISQAWTNITAEELKAKIDRGESFILLDVRPEKKYDSGHIPGAISMPLDEIPNRYTELSPEQEIIVYCQVGKSSQDAADMLINLGFTNVKNLEGGISAWNYGVVTAMGNTTNVQNSGFIQINGKPLGVGGGKPSQMPPEGAGGRTSFVSYPVTQSARVQYCICPVCGEVVQKPLGIPCASMSCPNCGSRLVNPQSGISSQNAPSGTGRVQFCVCPVCGTTVPHPIGIPCAQLTCPNCGSRMVNANTGNTISSPVTPQSNNLTQQLNTQQQFGSGINSFGQGGPGGFCICPNCGYIVPHQAGIACYQMTCPKCGSQMIRQIAAPLSSVSDQPENRPLGTKRITDRPDGKPPDINKTQFNLISETKKKVAVATAGPDMNSKLAPLFDKASYFIIVGFGTTKAVPNPNADDIQGAGIQSAHLIVDEGCGAVITKNISLEAMKALNELNVKVYSATSGTASQVVRLYESGILTEITLETPKTEEEHRSGKGMTSKDKMKFEKRAIDKSSL